MYRGKEVCQGCKTSGADRPRYDKDHLCQECKDIYTAGKSTIHEKSTSYKLVFQHYYAYNVDVLNKGIHNILDSITNPHAVTDSPLDYVKYSTGSNGKYYKIPPQAFEAIKNCFVDLDAFSWEVENEKRMLPEIAKKAVLAEKSKIFNEGIEKGKQLLFQLNNGDLTISDFDKPINYQP